MIADFLLVQKIRNGDNQAGNQLVEKYYSSIYQYCYLHTHNQEYAEIWYRKLLRDSSEH